jgi:hypothetical protein
MTVIPARVLFVLRSRGVAYDYQMTPISGDWANKSFTGLSNSARYVVDMLNMQDIEAALVVVEDYNKIDAAVAAYRPTHVIIEALWIPPLKFVELHEHHKFVRWNIRLHSEIPFISNEGIALQWIFGYVNLTDKHVSVSSNSQRMAAVLNALNEEQVFYTPNYYPLEPVPPVTGLASDDSIDVGCFGAIRPLKNQLSQAVAAIQMGNALGRSIRFHVNSDRVEGGGASILKNIQQLFENEPDHQLIEHPWLDRTDFLALVNTMDVGMQVSFSETFNLVAADFVMSNKAIVTSPEVSFVMESYWADPTNIVDIQKKLYYAWSGRYAGLHAGNLDNLKRYNLNSIRAWTAALSKMR